MKFESKTMRLCNPDTVPYLQYRSLSELPYIRHAFSTRLGGVSEGHRRRQGHRHLASAR